MLMSLNFPINRQSLDRLYKKTCFSGKGLRQQMNHTLFLDTSFHRVFQFRSYLLIKVSNTFRIKMASSKSTQETLDT